MTDDAGKPAPEPPDHQHYRLMWLRKDSLTHFRKAASYYDGLLEEAHKSLRKDEVLFGLLDERELRNLPIVKERERIGWLIGWFKKLEGQADEHGDVHFVDISHGTLRGIKSMCQLYESHLRQRRDRLAADPETSESTIEAIDARLIELGEKTKMGIFAQVSPAPLLVSVPSVARPAATTPAPSAQISSPVTERTSVHGLQLIDSELRARCGDLFSILSEKKFDEQYDTVIREIGTVVETRLRQASGAPLETIGVKLAEFAFGGDSPPLRLSEVKAEQDGVQSLFRGFFMWVRNPAGHRLLGKISKERVQQLLAFADYLLGLVGEGSARETDASP